MKAENDIIRITLPFAVGVAAAALSTRPVLCASLSLILSLSFLIASVMQKGKSMATIVAVFFFLGVFCRSSCSIGTSPQGLLHTLFLDSFQAHSLVTDSSPTPGLACRALEKLSDAIEEKPFRHRSTNALLRALLTGQKDGLGRETVAAFRKAGAAHILALSGLHLGVIYGMVRLALCVLGKSVAGFAVRSIATVCLSGFYVIMTGASPSTVRAFIFILLAEVSRHCPDRRKNPTSVWCAALLLQLVFNPRVISSSGFQLSYLAMLGIFTLFPVLQRWYPSSGSKADKLNPMRRIWDSVALAISCQLFTAPLVWLKFHSFPKYFLLTNLIALPLSEAFMISGVAALALGAIKICPRFLTEAVDFLAGALQESLDIIACL